MHCCSVVAVQNAPLLFLLLLVLALFLLSLMLLLWFFFFSYIVLVFRKFEICLYRPVNHDGYISSSERQHTLHNISQNSGTVSGGVVA